MSRFYLFPLKKTLVMYQVNVEIKKISSSTSILHTSSSSLPAPPPIVLRHCRLFSTDACCLCLYWRRRLLSAGASASFFRLLSSTRHATFIGWLSCHLLLHSSSCSAPPPLSTGDYSTCPAAASCPLAPTQPPVLRRLTASCS